MSEPFIGEVSLFGFTYAPRHWAKCDGQTLEINENPTLFALISTFYGGDGRTTMGLPDLRGRAPIHMGQGPGLPLYQLGEIRGIEQIRLSTAELPAHSHSAAFKATSSGGTASSPEIKVSTDTATLNTPTEGAYLAVNKDGRSAGIPTYRADIGSGSVNLGGVSGGATGGSVTGDVEIGDTGGGQYIPIRNPVLTMNYCIALDGLFPPRT